MNNKKLKLLYFILLCVLALAFGLFLDLTIFSVIDQTAVKSFLLDHINSYYLKTLFIGLCVAIVLILLKLAEYAAIRHEVKNNCYCRGCQISRSGKGYQPCSKIVDDFAKTSVISEKRSELIRKANQKIMDELINGADPSKSIDKINDDFIKEYDKIK